MNSDKSINPEQYYFGSWRFNANSGNLFDGETTTRLEPQVAKLLAYFLAHQNTLTSRDELIAAVWENRNVSDDAINRCISILRQILTPEDKNAYIETVVRRGFVSHFPAPPVKESGSTQTPGRRNTSVFVALAILSAVLFYSAFDRYKDTPSPPPPQDTISQSTPMLAVLPFASSGMEGDSEFFANGIHDDLLTQLAQLQSMRVISRTSVLEYRDTNQNMRDIGRELGVDAILEGGIQRIGDQIRINAQLIDANTDAHLWAGQYDRELLPANIFAVQTEITRAIASALHATLTQQDAKQINVLPTDNMAAYRAYHRAFEIRQTLNMDDPTYLQSLEEAVRLDPAFTRAWAEIAGYLSIQNFSRKDLEAIKRLDQVLETIRTQAPESADYLKAKAYYTYYVLKHYEEAYELIKKAQSLRPSDERIIEVKSWIERRLGDFEARSESMRLAQKLDPKNLMWTRTLVFNLTSLHHYDEASIEAEKFVDQDMRLAIMHSGLQMRNYQDAGRWSEDLIAIRNEFQEPSIPEDLWGSYIASRDYETARDVLAEMRAFGEHSQNYSFSTLAGIELNQLITYWFLQASDQLEPLLVQSRSIIDEQKDSDGKYSLKMHYLVMAFITAAEGNKEETEHMIRVWRRETSADLAEFTNAWHLSCRALGMAASTAMAVNCIRSGLLKPSFVTPYLEPFLPYYDSIRDQPEFVELLAEIQ